MEVSEQGEKLVLSFEGQQDECFPHGALTTRTLFSFLAAESR